MARSKSEPISPGTRKELLIAQSNEITEHFIYTNLARGEKDKANKATLSRIAADEKRHYEFWRRFTGEDVRPNKRRIIFFTVIGRVLGITFGIKLMEKGVAAFTFCIGIGMRIVLGVDAG